jgi:CheY-like chemotaxis protein
MSLPSQQPPNPNENPSGQQPSLSVLVIEDNQDLAKLFCDLLEVMGCATEMAFNARHGIEAARRLMPDLVFCDLRLPGEKNGFDLASELSADPALSAIPLIAVTGYNDAEEHQRALKAGFRQVFEKPVKFAQIMEVLNTYRKQ